MANVIILPIKASVGAGSKAASTLIHDLGHTIGGLADEYTGGSSERYLGPEPNFINVSRISPVLYQWHQPSYRKWEKWLGKRPKAQLARSKDYEVDSLKGNSGAYLFKSGILRPAKLCNMRKSDDVGFCPVCEETFTVKLLERLGLNDSTIGAPLTIEVQYLSPWRSPPKRYTVQSNLVYGMSNSVIDLEVSRSTLPLAGPTGLTEARPSTGVSEPIVTEVGVRVVRSAIPDGVQTIRRPDRDDEMTNWVATTPDTTAVVKVRPGTDVALPANIKSVLCQSVALRFVNDPVLNLSPPTNLTQSPRVGSLIKRVLNRKNGDLTIDIMIGAKSGSGENLIQMTETVFKVNSRGRPTAYYSLEDKEDEIEKHRIQLQGLSLGQYEWKAFSRIAGTSEAALQSQEVGLPVRRFHFQVIGHDVPSYTKLPRPFELVVRTAVRFVKTRGLVAVPGSIGIPDLLGTPGVPEIPVGPGFPEIPVSPGFPEIPVSPGVPEGVILPVMANEPDVTRMWIQADAYHPAGKSLRFEFEFADDNRIFAGVDTFTTHRITTDSQSSLKVTGSRELDRDNDYEKLKREWRVRTIDDDNVKSDWVISKLKHKYMRPDLSS